MSTDFGILQARIVELETRLAFQDNTIEELNEVIINQQHQLDRLESGLATIKGQLKQFAGQSGAENGRHDC
jgi:SlyX protein